MKPLSLIGLAVLVTATIHAADFELLVPRSHNVELLAPAWSKLHPPRAWVSFAPGGNTPERRLAEIERLGGRSEGVPEDRFTAQIKRPTPRAATFDGDARATFAVGEFDNVVSVVVLAEPKELADFCNVGTMTEGAGAVPVTPWFTPPNCYTRFDRMTSRPLVVPCIPAVTYDVGLVNNDPTLDAMEIGFVGVIYEDDVVWTLCCMPKGLETPPEPGDTSAEALCPRIDALPAGSRLILSLRRLGTKQIPRVAFKQVTGGRPLDAEPDQAAPVIPSRRPARGELDEMMTVNKHHAYRMELNEEQQRALAAGSFYIDLSGI